MNNTTEQENRYQLFKVVSSIASGLKASILYLLIAGTSASSYIAWKWIDFSSHYSLIILKVLPLLIPVFIWAFLYMIISELAELPSMTKTAKEDGEVVVNRFKHGKELSEKPVGFWGKLKSLFNVLRGAGNLASILGAVSSAAFIVNPLSALVFFISGLTLMLFALIAILVLIF